MKKYFTIDEVAAHLTTPTRSFGRRDVLDLAMREKLRLAFWFDGELHRFRARCGGGYVDPGEEDPEAWHVSARGYFGIPASQIAPDSDDFVIDHAEPIESPLWSSRAWRMGSRWCVLGAVSRDGDEARHVPIRIGIDAVFVPAEDVRALNGSEASAAEPIAEGNGGSDELQAANSRAALVERPGQPASPHQLAEPCVDSSTKGPMNVAARAMKKRTEASRRRSKDPFFLGPASQSANVPRDVAAAAATSRFIDAKNENTTNGMVAWQRALLESWREIAAAYSGNPKPRDVMRWLKRYGPRDVIPDEQPNSESMVWITSDGLSRTVPLKTIQNRFSELKKSGKLLV